MRYAKVMSLTDEDLSQVRDVAVSAIQELMLPRFEEHDRRFDRIEGRLDEVEADIKELYAMVDAQKPGYADKKFAKLSIEQKVLKTSRHQTRRSTAPAPSGHHPGREP